jgi:hypothetical protein
MIRPSTLFKALILLAALAALAMIPIGCDDTDGDGDGDADSDGDGDADSDGDADGDPPCTTSDSACVDEGCHAGPYDITCVGGTVVDPAGSAMAGTNVVVCTGMTCFTGETDASGWFAVGVTASVGEVTIYFNSEAPIHSPFCAFRELCDGAIHLCDEFVLYPAPTSGLALSHGQVLEADTRVVADDDGAIILRAGSEAYMPLGAPEWIALTRFPLDEHAPCFIDPANPPVALYSVTPSDVMVIEQGTDMAPVLEAAGLDLPNDAGLAAGATVDIFVLGGSHPLDAGMTEGEWRAWTTAIVSAEGSRIQTPVGEGIGYLTWFAVYPR